MQKGHSDKLLVEELITLLKELGELFGYALDAQDSSENTDVMISLSWYQYFLNDIRSDLAMVASSLAQDGRATSVFSAIGIAPMSAKRHITLHDLKEKHDKFKMSHDTTRLAYTDFINSHSPTKLVMNAADQQLRSASANLRQALEAL